MANPIQAMQTTDFNPLPRKEGDGAAAYHIAMQIKFQSTPS